MTVLESTATPAPQLQASMPNPAQNPTLTPTYRAMNGDRNAYYIRTAYNKQRVVEHKYLKAQVPKELATDTKIAVSTNRAQREARILACWDAALKKREQKATPTPTLRSRFPEHYDEVTERMWVLGEFMGAYQGAEEDDDDDDDDEAAFGPPAKEAAKFKKIREEQIEEEGQKETWRRDDGLSGLGRWCARNMFGPGLGQDGKEGEEPCVAFSLSVQLESMPELATKSYWGFDENMEMVLVMPLTSECGNGGEAGTAAKRTGEEISGGRAKKMARW